MWIAWAFSLDNWCHPLRQRQSEGVGDQDQSDRDPRTLDGRGAPLSLREHMRCTACLRGGGGL